MVDEGVSGKSEKVVGPELRLYTKSKINIVVM